jgi:hypothetical protein
MRFLSIVFSFILFVSAVSPAVAQSDVSQMYRNAEYGFEMSYSSPTRVVNGFGSVAAVFKSPMVSDVRIRIYPFSYKRSLYLARLQGDHLVENTAIWVQNRPGFRTVFRHVDGSETLYHVLSLSDDETVVLSAPRKSYRQRSILESFRFFRDDIRSYSSSRQDYQFEYPQSYRLRVEEDSRSRHKLNFVSEENWFTVEVNESHVGVRKFVGEDSDGTLFVGSMLGEVYQFERGICSGVHCSEPFVAVRVHRNSKEYVWVFHGKRQLDEVARGVLESVQFN